jgi:ABC-type polar amino acid transport system ATPase subunit
MTTGAAIFAGKNLEKSYGEQKIIRGVDVELEPGKISVIIGPSGAGKTTLLKLLALLEFPDSGTIHIDGLHYTFPVKNKKEVKPPWPEVTVVFQQLFLWPHLTLLQNITLPLAMQNKEIDKEQLDQLISLFGMEKFIYRYPNQASIGQRQRAAIARALLLKPKYILLDEITSSLDVEQVEIILQHLKNLALQGIGILTITHLLHFAKEAADRILFMEQGMIIESGGREVLVSPKHERVQKFLSVIEAAR